jgi:hypothetical protein
MALRLILDEQKRAELKAQRSSYTRHQAVMAGYCVAISEDGRHHPLCRYADYEGDVGLLSSCICIPIPWFRPDLGRAK